MLGSALGGAFSSFRASLPSSREAARTFAVGLCMGTADAVPGVSGGTVALIAGVYERLVDAITAVTGGEAVDLARSLLADGFSGGGTGDEAVELLSRMDVWFLMTLGVGMLTAVVFVTRAVTYANEAVPVVLFGFFFGLIGVSAALLFRDVSLGTPGNATAALAGFAIAFLVAGQTAVGGASGLAFVFVAGVVGVSAMLLPGISGSLLLIVLGQYTHMSESLTQFVDGVVGLLGGGSRSAVVDPGVDVAVFVLGGFVGLVTVSRIVRRALDANRQGTLAFLVALVAGALRAPVQRVGPRTEFTIDVLLVFGIAAAVGAGLLLALDRFLVDVSIDDA